MFATNVSLALTVFLFYFMPFSDVVLWVPAKYCNARIKRTIKIVFIIRPHRSNRPSYKRIEDNALYWIARLPAREPFLMCTKCNSRHKFVLDAVFDGQPM